MDERKHTPGPWSVCGAEGCTCAAVLYRDGIICEVRTFNDDMADATGHAPSPDEAQANKRLIAAAPELLASLDLIVDALQSGYVPETDGGIIKDARAALAKAGA